MPDSPAVIIVGAGPAGSITALLLARRGIPVLLLDRAAFPRPKPCGDCLSAAATGLLRRVGLLDDVLAAGATEIGHWRIIAPDGTPAVGGFGDAMALSLERQRLDAVLLDAAIAAGAGFRHAQVTDLVVREGRVRGVLTLDGGEGRRAVEAPLVVGADGLRSIVARRLNLVQRRPRLRKVSLTAHLPAPPGTRPTVPHGTLHGEMHVTPDGCIGYAPAGQGRVNVTLVVTTDAARDLGTLGPADFFRDRLRHVPGLRDRLDASLEALDEDAILASGPFDVPVRRPVFRGGALVGDAAGYYDPFTGQGIYQAMAAAELLARAVAPVMARASGRPPGRRLDLAPQLDGALRQYGRDTRRLTAPARRVQRGVEAVLSRPWLANRILRRLAHAPAAMDRVIEVTGDLRPPASLLSPPVVSSFMIPRLRRYV